MKEEKYFFGKLTRKVPEKEWEADYLVKKGFDGTLGIGIFLFYVLGLLTLIVILVLGYHSQQCSANFEVEGKGAVGLTNNYLKTIDSPLKSFEFNEGKVKVNATIPCYYFKNFTRGG